ncbi:substrate-binding domain-containing protein [Actinoplanes sp. L3-i22]|uniref:substrate-binding domain-containing protein n=1 Tax=Actinoplanes sp. L3-i22 TaxID=2836373 RepID=UPI001C786E4B|nr:substrate-binding domain-containing protein [Actinoplanes sp. L3-i22]BCY09638.1 LacI family transcriptional regulator [Actinoplanes sp. L3-i22]
MVERGARGPAGRHGLISEVARAAQVSVSTVSKVVHGRRDVGAATRARVEALLAEHGYPRDGAGDGRPRQILTVFRDLAGPYTLEVVRGIVTGAAEAGAHAVIGMTNRQPISRWLDECEAMGAAGMILVISMLAEQDQQRIVEQHIPVVLVDPLSEPVIEIPSIGVTNWKGGRTAVEHLLGLGHRRIGMLAGRPHSVAGAARLHGYRAALAEAGIDVDPALVKASDFDFEEAVAATTQLLALPRPPTAIFAASDAQALGALEAARRAGCRVPDELSVVSFDDTAVAAMASPPLTAVCQPFEDMGRVAVQTLIQLAEGRAVPAPRVELTTRLVIRESTAAPR